MANDYDKPYDRLKWVWSLKLKPGEKHVLEYLALRVFPESALHPSIRTIGAHTSRDDKQVQVLINRLVERGVLRVERSKGGMRGDTNKYSFCYDYVTPDQRGVPVPPQRGVRVPTESSSSSKPLTSIPGTPDLMPTEDA